MIEDLTALDRAGAKAPIIYAKSHDGLWRGKLDHFEFYKRKSWIGGTGKA